MHDLQTSFEKIKDAIKITQLKQKSAVDKHRRSLDFKVDDWVLLKFLKAAPMANDKKRLARNALNTSKVLW